ncbi:MAG: ABC transporter ATP-binding protein [Verrucomicrobia bacterium]|nr:ABC transporter ATP-binding protein [Verrucomicrobiota bacterium]
MNQAIIQIRDVWKSFSPKKGGAAVHVLESINVDVYPGEFVCIVGPSGCGKSTLLNIVAGFVRPSRGEVLIRGQAVTGPSRERIFVFQENGVFPWLNVRDNIGFGVQISGAKKQAIIEHYVQMVGLQGFEHAYPHELSGGMRQRVEIARALAADPALIFMDEPFGALDFLTRLKMRTDLTAIWQKERKTILFVTHDIEESVQLADRIIVMSSRPAKVNADVPVELPRPRDLDAPEYLQLRDAIFERLGMSLKVGATG